MRHRRKGRVLGRAPAHRKALFSNMVTAIILTEREVTELDPNPPKVPGRIITTLEKAKEIRPLVEKCITIAKKGLIADQKAVELRRQRKRVAKSGRSGVVASNAEMGRCPFTWRNGETKDLFDRKRSGRG